MTVSGHQWGGPISWHVPEGPAGLAGAIGGAAATRERLDAYFSYPATEAAPGAVPLAQSSMTMFGTQYRGTQHAPDNEHDPQVPLYYNWVGQPWKSQAVMRSVQEPFTPAPAGLTGNDDLGSLTG